MCTIQSILRKMEMCHISLQAICRNSNIHQKQFVTSQKEFSTLQQLPNKAKIICVDWASNLQPVQEQLLHFIFELWEQGMDVKKTIMVILREACTMRGLHNSRLQDFSSRG